MIFYLHFLFFIPLISRLYKINPAGNLYFY